MDLRHDSPAVKTIRSVDHLATPQSELSWQTDSIAALEGIAGFVQLAVSGLITLLGKIMLPPLRTLVPFVMLVVAAARAARSLFALLFSALLLWAMASGALAQPTNDAFANATVLPLATVLTGSNLGATKEANETEHGDDGGGSVWWKFTAPVSKRFILDWREVTTPRLREFIPAVRWVV